MQFPSIVFTMKILKMKLVFLNILRDLCLYYKPIDWDLEMV